MTSNNTFRTLHQGPALLLPNAWDPGSARLIESLGAKAIATTSAGLAWSRGYPDGDALPIEQLLAATRDIARSIRVPLTIDIEGGYSIDPTIVAQVVGGVIDVGAVGINLEDGAGPRTAVHEDRSCKEDCGARRRRLVHQCPHRCLSARLRDGRCRGRGGGAPS